jgi:putative ABC transport system permease protein
VSLQPPRVFERLLHLALSADDAEVIGGDLEETFRTAAATQGRRAAAWKYRAQVASVIAARIRNSDPVDPRRRRANMSAIRQDVAYAVRSLRKGPAFTATAVLLLALGLGANVAIFSLVRAVMLKPLPFANPDRLMLVHMLGPERDEPGVFRHFIWSYPKYLLYRDSQKGFESTAAFTSSAWNLTGAGAADRVTGELVEASYFSTLGVQAVAGRIFSASETASPGSEPIVILGHGMWMRRFGGAPVVGQTIGLNGIPHTIVGVLPPGFRGLTGQAELWVPLTTQPADVLAEKWNHSYTVVGRRGAQVSATQADAEARTVGAAIDAAIPDPENASVHWSARAVPLNDQRVDPLVRRSMMLLLVAVAAVLLLVCINMANLVLVRALARQREVAIRLALGANRLRIVRQLMTESVLLASMGAVAALAVAYLLVTIGASMMPDLRMVLPRGDASGLTRVGLSGVGFDSGVLLFTVGLALLSAVLFGLGPAWRASRRDLTEAMKSASSGAVSSDVHGGRVRAALVVGEIALALVLLTAGGLMLKSVSRLQATELGFEPSGLLSARIALPGPQYTAARATQFLDQLVERLSHRPGVTAVGYGNCPPVSGGCNGTTATFPDRPPVSPGAEPPVGVLWASPEYFQTLGIRLVRGRVFTDRDTPTTPKVVVINESAARAFWGNEDPIGKRIGVGQGGFSSGAEVVGVVADVRYGAVETSVQPDVYLPLLQSMRASGFVFLRGAVSTEALVATVRAELQALDPNLPLTDVKLMDQRFGEATWRTRVSATLLAGFAGLALLLATLGLYSVMSQGVEQRRREIGLRLALGATRGDILRLIVGRVILIAGTGSAVGILLAIPAGRLLSGLLYQVRPGDPVVLAVLSLALMTIALLAGFIPARRATRVDPLTSLRSE